MDNNYHPMNQYGPAAPQPPKKNKEKKKYSLASLLSVTLVSALICGLISATCVMLATRANTSTGGETSSTVSANAGNTGKNDTSSTGQQQIQITGTTDNLAEAVAEKASPSVVGIRVTYTSSQGGYFGGSSTATSEGSGVIYTQDGYIITNYHVISGAVSNSEYGTIAANSKIQVYLPSDPDTAIDASIIGYDSSSDLAVIKIDKTGLPAMEIGNSDELKVGESAFAIGNPGGLEFMGSISQGIISGLNRKIVTESGTQMNLVQTDAAINPGNSGGALVDKEGKLIGINNAKKSGTDYEGMGFAIPVNEVVEICDRLIKNGNVVQTYLGVIINPNYTSDILNRMGYPSGVVVYSVDEDSPAADAGIQTNDIITKVNGVEISDYAGMISEKNKYDAGQTISITIFRNGRTADVNVTLRAASK